MDDLIQSIKNKDVILFVGSGLSRILGLPNFEELIDEIAKKLNFDPGVFKTMGDYSALAEYYYIEKDSLGELRSWLDLTWHNPKIKIEESVPHKLLIELDFPIIYTTNYDRWIEKAYNTLSKPFIKIKNVKDLVQIKDGITQIIKFHGDFDDDNSIVLTESSYFERMNFESPLDIKLRSDSLGKSILFIGYSLGDTNIKLLLYKLKKFWDSTVFASTRPKSYIYLNKPNKVQEKILESRGITPIVYENDNSNEGLNEFLNDLVSGIKN